MRFVVLVCLFLNSFIVPVVAQQIPVIYSTDLFHPPDDPDDHYDLATLFALPELDIRAIILDQGRDQNARPGAIPVEQLNALTGRKIPYVRGLAHPLRYPADTGEDIPGGQEGPELILRVLRESSQKVVIITVGSLRDVAASFNRDPQLFHQKVARIYVNAGHSGGQILEWNTALDPLSYLQIMKSDLPVYWVPCFSSSRWQEEYAADDVHTEPHQSYWSFRQGDLLDDLPSGLQNYFLYALGRVPPSVEDPIAYLQKPVDPQLKSKHWPRTREMWSTVSLYHAAGKTLQHRGDTWILAPISDTSGPAVFEFTPGRVLIDSNLRTTIEKPASGVSFQILKINDLQNYRQAMFASLHQLLKTMPLARRYQK